MTYSNKKSCHKGYWPDGDAGVRGSLDGVRLLTVMLRVRDLETSTRWCREALALEPIHVGCDGPANRFAAYVMAGTVLTLWELPPGETRDPADNHRNSYVTFVSERDPAGVRAELAARGVAVGDVQTSEHNTFFWFYDPDHNRFEVSRPRTAEFMAHAARAEAAADAAVTDRTR